MFLTTPVDTTKASVFKYFYTQQTWNSFTGYCVSVIPSLAFFTTIQRYVHLKPWSLSKPTEWVPLTPFFPPSNSFHACWAHTIPQSHRKLSFPNLLCAHSVSSLIITTLKFKLIIIVYECAWYVCVMQKWRSEGNLWGSLSPSTFLSLGSGDGTQITLHDKRLCRLNHLAGLLWVFDADFNLLHWVVCSFSLCFVLLQLGWLFF